MLAEVEISPREAEVLELVGAHLSNAEIAAKLCISVRTVESHVSSLLRKLEAPDRRALAQRAPEPAGSGSSGSGPSRPAPVLPAPLTSFVGRVSERAQLTDLIRTHRQITAVGPGGVGKTRLALAVAADAAGDYADGVWFVDLVPVADPGMIATAVAGALGLGEQPGRDLTDSVLAALADRHALLILDNCEQVVDGVALFLERLLAACPRLTVLATSRARLMVPFERVYPVPRLSLSADGSSDAVALFLERAAATGHPLNLPPPPTHNHPPPSRTAPAPNHTPTPRADPAPGRTPDSSTDAEPGRTRDPGPGPRFGTGTGTGPVTGTGIGPGTDPLSAGHESHPAQGSVPNPRSTTPLSPDALPGASLRERISVICERLDGMALAIELAAARYPTLGLDGITAALSHPLRMLTGGSRADERHRSMRAALDWSHTLLEPSDRALLRRVSVFVAPFTVAAAAEVAGSDEGLVADGLARLAEQSLLTVTASAAGTEYRALETIRQYGTERLTEAGELAATRTRHLRWCLAQAAGLAVVRQDWRARFDLVADDLRAALAWAAEQPEQRSDACDLARMLAELTFTRNLTGESQRRYEQAAELATDPAVTAAMLRQAAAVAGCRTAGDDMYRLRRAAAEAAREAGDTVGTAVDLATAATIAFRFSSTFTRLPTRDEALTLITEARRAATGHPPGDRPTGQGSAGVDSADEGLVGADPAVRAAVALAEAAVITDTFGAAQGPPGNAVPETNARAERAVELARETGDPLAVSAALDALTGALSWAGDTFATAATARHRIALLSSLSTGTYETISPTGIRETVSPAVTHEMFSPAGTREAMWPAGTREAMSLTGTREPTSQTGTHEMISPAATHEMIDALGIAVEAGLGAGDVLGARQWARRLADHPSLAEAGHRATCRLLMVDALAGDVGEVLTGSVRFLDSWRRAGSPSRQILSPAAAGVAMIHGLRGDHDARREWQEVVRQLGTPPEHTYGYGAVFDAILLLHDGQAAEALERMAPEPRQVWKWVTWIWLHWYVALRAEAAVLAGSPDARARLTEAGNLVEGNPVAAAIVRRAEAVLDNDGEALVAVADAFAAAGCPYQAARTLVLAGGDHAERGASALAALGLTPMTPSPGPMPGSGPSTVSPGESS
ncbi:LuxR C-terminal-related transcriptional regulator [Nonomuraea fuscirosea]|uniref:LuxR C-terminal-related transcriptional regulator n=1 Tax=Nonomuraea fuscirosea TaxID=1291556 RepID=UPI002DDA0AFA|nr:LuxR C-terminal-related transcriptional regulator [Nonomuraea fuscirosea]WSA48653.1 LuxR C-terminal-related transcriptional regulator [Nonomuraea fuscirosea]